MPDLLFFEENVVSQINFSPTRIFWTKPESSSSFPIRKMMRTKTKASRFYRAASLETIQGPNPRGLY